MDQAEQEFLTVRDKSRRVRLENWTTRYKGRVKHLKGNAYGHPRFPDGQMIRTSLVLFMDETVAYTLNTRYLLAKRAPLE